MQSKHFFLKVISYVCLDEVDGFWVHVWSLSLVRRWATGACRAACCQHSPASWRVKTGSPRSDGSPSAWEEGSDWKVACTWNMRKERPWCRDGQKCILFDPTHWLRLQCDIQGDYKKMKKMPTHMPLPYIYRHEVWHQTKDVGIKVQHFLTSVSYNGCMLLT